MVNTVETVGIVVNSIYPLKKSTDVPIDTIIELEFNTDLKIGSLFDSVKLYKSLDEDFKHFEELKGEITYSSRVIKFKPSENLESNTLYKVSIEEGILKDINNNTMLVPFTSSFKTARNENISYININYPKNNSILNKLEYINISSDKFSRYDVQISSKNDFTSIVFEKSYIPQDGDYDSITIMLDDLKLEERNYYIRVVDKENNICSNQIQIGISDVKEFDEFEETDSFFDDIALVKTFPSNGAINVSRKINHVYIIVTGNVKKEDINDFNIEYVSLSDEDSNDYLEINLDNLILEYNKENDTTSIFYKLNTGNSESVTRKNSNSFNYGQVETIEENMIYKITANIKNIDISYQFVSYVNPKYCTVNQIRLEAGEFLASISDIDIIKKIHEYSLEGLELYEDQVESDVPTRALKRWVKYSVLIDLCNKAYIEIAGNNGSQSKSIGDINISISRRIPYLSEILKLFKQELQDALDSMDDDSMFATAPRAGSTTYPLDSRVGF
ncbi:bacterial Ig-like domain protein (plasmid) [Clostridium baratii str. Sullivan]|uniref:Bacterial Ig-like domain protein n=1 Tax=Clostridium baratii str. Sullivan TaxID=1415775 RepID=A0A0A7G0J7_9CLOT|nr:Ig-like domain-containing protein [Clostridium baratii]AIY85394.1 bacterial Ig-like domain protein [Clostridium baratii str. Sullivan]